jgi:DeoR family glycerol-3-phosphate regulon repressor
MHLITRHEQILGLAKLEERVFVDDLSARFKVTPQTIRKDLNDLCQARLLVRVHGGAELPSGIVNLEYEERRQLAAGEKLAIGEAAANLIPNESSLFINIGTTTEAVSEALLDHDGLMVVTNNINVANRMRVYPKFEVVMAGGVVRSTDGGIVGETAVDFFRQFKVDYAVIGSSAIDPDGTLLDFDIREVKVAQAIIENARHVILVGDASKFDRSAPVRIADFSLIDSFVTDYCPDDSIRQMCVEHEVQLIEAVE